MCVFVCVCAALLDQLEDTSGDTIPNEDLTKMLEEARRLVKEMEQKNFNPQKVAAEKERDEAQKRKSPVP